MYFFFSLLKTTINDDIHKFPCNFRTLSKMQPVLCIEHLCQPPIYQKGKVDCIKIDVQQRASNKKVGFIYSIQ
jgi:hypothetical protein